MDSSGNVFRSALICFALALSACGGGGYGDDSSGAANTPPAPPQAGIGPAGGTVNGPNGSQVVIPAGALAANTPIQIQLTTTALATLPQGITATGQMFSFLPHGTTFAVPVTMTIPFNPASIPAGSSVALFKTNAQNQFEQLTNATFGASSASAQVTSFSDLTAGTLPPLSRADPIRTWSFREFLGDQLDEIEVASDTQTGGLLQEFFDFGPAVFDHGILFADGTELEPDGIATGEITSFANGVTYWVGAEAPRGNTAIDDPIGSKSRLIQYQTFTKNAADASYSFTLSTAFIETLDGNAILNRTCPQNRNLEGTACDLIQGEIYLDVQAFTVPVPENPPEPAKPAIVFFRTAGGASVNGSAGSWLTSAWNEPFSRTPLWSTENFDFFPEDFNGPEGAFSMVLGTERTYSVDLSSVDVGESFTVKVEAYASTYNRAASAVSGEGAEFETAANAWLRDPATIGGTTVSTTGLTAIDTPVSLVDPVEVPVSPAPCVPGPGPDPEAGVLQFSAATYTLTEGQTTPVIVVTRTGGSTGAVSTTFTTTDGTAVGGVDYTPVNATVFFAAGDTTARAVRVPIVQDDTRGEPDKTVNLTLSQPGGCAALGAQTTALLTIRDDDPAPPPPTGLDPTFSGDGKVTLEGFGGDRSGMAVQPDGKVVMVGGTFVDWVMARFNADGSVDQDFGDDGRVITNFVNNVSEESLGVAIQPDNKIVVVGYSGLSVALARYLPDGTLDDTFGVDGKAFTSVVGRAFAVALQPDGKIVIAGDVPSTEDFLIARFNPNGSSDFSFANGGLTTDINVGSDLASNLVLQPDGFIVISGPHTNFGETTRNQHTGLMRVDTNGVPDNTFGTAGKVLLTGVSVGEGLVRQSTGKYVLAGRINVAAPSLLRNEFLLMRLGANGVPDNTFGTAGKVQTQISTLGDDALAVALQADGKIVAAGRSRAQVNANFAVVRYSSEGVLDTTFANGGKLEIDFGGSDIAENVVVANGKIVLGGLVRINVDGYGVARVNQ